MEPFFRIGDKVLVSSIWDCRIVRISGRPKFGYVRIDFPRWHNRYNTDVPFETILNESNNRAFRTFDHVHLHINSEFKSPVRVHFEDPAVIDRIELFLRNPDRFKYRVIYTGEGRIVTQWVNEQRIRADTDEPLEDSFTPDANSTILSESSRLLQCVLCGEVYMTSEELERHSLGDHLYCPYCDVKVAPHHKCPHVQLPSSIEYRVN